ncbi:MAG: hypothetical protein DDT40_01909 [candidate division WS2 bacterium]|nr:hypothetical protein [Candidatus Psychracetigena formicireducens]
MSNKDIFKRPRRMLVDIDWTETSGVDYPANQVEGWVVMKAKNSKISKAEVDIGQFEDVFYSLDEIDWEAVDAPQPVKDAVYTILEWLEPKMDESPEKIPAGKSRERNLYKWVENFVRAAKRVFSNKQVEVPDKVLDEELSSQLQRLKDLWPRFCDEIEEILSSEDKSTILERVQQAYNELVRKVNQNTVMNGNIFKEV